MKAVLEEVVEKEMSEHFDAGYRELSPQPDVAGATDATLATR